MCEPRRRGGQQSRWQGKRDQYRPYEPERVEAKEAKTKEKNEVQKESNGTGNAQGGMSMNEKGEGAAERRTGDGLCKGGRYK